ncbi:MAG: hypothetical protein FWF81_13155 [Defluviitaleaceae bacterium]|nr:hypothetical protein [Defluviitaleaceae bacterium]
MENENLNTLAETPIRKNFDKYLQSTAKEFQNERRITERFCKFAPTKHNGKSGVQMPKWGFRRLPFKPIRNGHSKYRKQCRKLRPFGS